MSKDMATIPNTLVKDTETVLDDLFSVLAVENDLLRNNSQDDRLMETVIAEKISLSNRYYECAKKLKPYGPLDLGVNDPEAEHTALGVKLNKLKAALYENQRLLKARYAASKTRVDAIMAGLEQAEGRQKSYAVISGGKKPEKPVARVRQTTA